MNQEIKHGNRGWELVEFTRQMSSGNNPEVIERFVYERFGVQQAVGYRTEGDTAVTIVPVKGALV